MAAFALLFFVALATFVIYHFWKHQQLKKLIDKFDGPEPYWFVGNALHIKRDPFDWFEQSVGVAELYSNPRAYRIWFFNIPYVITTGPVEAEPILNNIRHTVKTDEYKFIRPFIGKGLFVNEGDAWRPRRKLITPAFHGEIIRHFVPAFRNQANILAGIFGKLVGSGPFNVYQYLSNCALAVVWEAAMGTDMNIQTVDSEYTRAVHRIGEILYHRHRSPWLWPDPIYNLTKCGKEQKELIRTIQGVIGNVIEKRWGEVSANGCDQNQNKTNHVGGSGAIESYKSDEDFTILDFWLDHVKRGVLTLKDVREEAASLLFGGFDTTATSSNWVLHYIGCYPEVQAKVHQELDTVLGNDEDREISHEDLKNLTYVECCIKEALRLMPPASIIGRRIAEDVVIAGRHIPAGTSVLVDIFSIHHDPSHWPDPYRFIPERHLPENAAGRHAFAYIPFSAGIRNCIAQRFAMLNEKMLLATLLRRFKVKSLERPDQVRAKPDIILRPSRILIELSRR